jgi:hypothetical protein
MEVAGVSGTFGSCELPERENEMPSSLICSLRVVVTDSVSLAVDSRRNTLDRLCELGVRIW